MHPSYRSTKPGIAPDCGMQLVPVYAEDLGRTSHVSSLTNSGIAHVDTASRQLYGIRLTQVEQSSSHGTLRVYGRVAADETRIYRVNLGTDGYVKETRGDAVGNHVARNQHLAIVYSPEFLSVAGGYLSANERTPGGNAKDTAVATQNAASAQARADRLRNLGMSDVQIEEISVSRKIPEDVYVVSPTDGFILSRDISPGMRFERHAELYRIADLSHVWILAEVFGRDAQAFLPGTTVHVTLPDTGESFTARVSNVLPELDPVTRTLKPRLELANPGFHLRPGMFVDLELPTLHREGVTIPVDAVLNTGLVKRVFVETSEDNFEAREVQTGWSFGDRIQITKGVQVGDKVVSSGTFLIDSETRINQAIGSTNLANPSPKLK
jgi:RND family efflux transporter MFP subunit